MSTRDYRDEHAALLERQAALEAEIAQLKAEKAGAPPPPPAVAIAGGRRAGILVAFVVAFVVLTGVYMTLVARHSSGHRSPPPPRHAVAASWEGTVTRASGAARVSPGDRCQISARIDYEGSTVQGVHQTVITCGGVLVYSEAAMFAAGNALEVSSNASHVNGKYDFMYDERGVATRPYPHASVDTVRGHALIEGKVPAVDIELAVEPGSKAAVDSPGQ